MDLSFVYLQPSGHLWRIKSDSVLFLLKITPRKLPRPLPTNTLLMPRLSQEIDTSFLGIISKLEALRDGFTTMTPMKTLPTKPTSPILSPQPPFPRNGPCHCRNSIISPRKRFAMKSNSHPARSSIRTSASRRKQVTKKFVSACELPTTTSGRNSLWFHVTSLAYCRTM